MNRMTPGRHTESDVVPSPDYVFWARMPAWSMSEAAALLLGLDPETTTPVKGPAEADRGSAHVGYERLRRLMRRARDVGELARLEVPREVIAWAKQNAIPGPELLLEQVTSVSRKGTIRGRLVRLKKTNRRLHEEIETLRAKLNAASDEAIDARERRTFQKMILGMAKAKFGFKEGNDRSNAVSKIQHALGDGKTKVSDDTILAKLREAMEAIGHD